VCVCTGVTRVETVSIPRARGEEREGRAPGDAEKLLDAAPDGEHLRLRQEVHGLGAHPGALPPFLLVLGDRRGNPNPKLGISWPQSSVERRWMNLDITVGPFSRKDR